MSEKLNINDITRILPHRYPFLLVDKILSIDLDKGIIKAQKNLTINEAFFQGHFPEVPIMPGVLIIEALAQSGGVLVHMGCQEAKDKIAVLLNIKNAKFRHPVRPGDVLTLICEGIHFSSNGGRVRATAYVDEKLAADAEIAFALVDKNQLNS